MNGLLEKLKNKNLTQTGTKTELYQTCKDFNDYISGGLSKKSVPELKDIINVLNQYRYKNKQDKIDRIDGIINFGNKQITLDDEQLKIVTHKPKSHMRILAGAGSGKTTTILCRIKYLVDYHIPSNKILVLTFNVDACESLRSRCKELFGFEINIEIRTIDSFCSYIKYKYDTTSTVDKITSFGVGDQDYITSLSELAIEGERIMNEIGDTISADYQYVFFDEFQDVNTNQFNILKIFAERGSFLTVIGDDNQNIYQWRGSNNYYIINEGSPMQEQK